MDCKHWYDFDPGDEIAVTLVATEEVLEGYFGRYARGGLVLFLRCNGNLERFFFEAASSHDEAIDRLAQHLKLRQREVSNGQKEEARDNAEGRFAAGAAERANASGGAIAGAAIEPGWDDFDLDAI
jgi:hypothetical protein